MTEEDAFGDVLLVPSGQASQARRPDGVRSGGSLARNRANGMLTEDDSFGDVLLVPSGQASPARRPDGMLTEDDGFGDVCWFRR